MISIVVCSINPEKFQKVSARYSRLFANYPHEIVGIHDATSLSSGYNRGIAASKGSILILSHDDIEILTTDFGPRVLHHLRTYDLLGIAGTTHLMEGKWAAAGDPYVYTLISSPQKPPPGFVTMLVGGGPLVKDGIHAIDGVLMIMNRSVASKIQFDEDTFDGFHLYDLDFSFRAYRAGHKIAVCRDLVIIHESTGTYDVAWAKYKGAFENKHRNALDPKLAPKEGARATFASQTAEAISRNCDFARLNAMVNKIEGANRQL